MDDGSKPNSLEEDWERAQKLPMVKVPREALSIWYMWGYEEGWANSGPIKRYDNSPEYRFRDSWSFQQGLKDGLGDRHARIDDEDLNYWLQAISVS